MNDAKKIHIKQLSSEEELSRKVNFVQNLKNTPIPDNELLSNLALYLRRQDLTQILFINELYKQILSVHGVIIEFGVRWGRNLALFHSLRGMYEPFNYSRKIIGFDTFEGFPSVHAKDGQTDVAKTGAYAVTENYEEYLTGILDYHEKESPIPHLRKFELVKGDASVQIKKYLELHPETIIAMAYFDMDIYEPTKNCLEAIQPYLTRGSVIGFDELNYPNFPGETVALRETLGLSHFAIKRNPFSSVQSYMVVE